MASANPQQCQWSDSDPCQFDEGPGSIHSFQGRDYCRWHMPLDNPDRITIGPEEMARAENQRGVQFPSAGYSFGPKGLSKLPRDLSKCAFASGVQLTLTGGNSNFEGSTFIGEAVLVNMHRGEASFRAATFKGRLQVTAMDRNSAGQNNEARKWTFEDATFCGQVDFRNANFVESLRIDRATFLMPVAFDGSTFPQQTSAVSIKFKRSTIRPDFEGSYRYARGQFAAQKNRELEGLFFTLEKRCQRKSLPWAWSGGTRFFSWLYDVSSHYGCNYGRAFLLFVAVQCVFAFVYALAAGRLMLTLHPDADVWTFTLSQVAKPFELLSARVPGGGSYETMLSHVANKGWLTALTIIQSVISLTLVALFLFAVRWRFRRES